MQVFTAIVFVGLLVVALWGLVITARLFWGEAEALRELDGWEVNDD